MRGRWTALFALFAIACGARTALEVASDAGQRADAAVRDGSAPSRDAAVRRDAGPLDAGARDGGRADGGFVPRCTGAFTCSGIPHVTGSSVLELDSGVRGGNVEVGSFAVLSDVVAVGWGERTCCEAYGVRLSASGVVRIGSTSMDVTVAFPAAATAGPAAGIPPALFLLDSGLLLVDTRAPAYDAAYLMDASGALRPAAPPLLSGDVPGGYPVTVAAAGANAVVELSPTVRVRELGPDLVEHWSAELGEEGTWGELVATCDGYAALWATRGDLIHRFQFAAIGSDGSVRARREIAFVGRERAVWDGRALVVAGWYAVLELSSEGETLSETPLAAHAKLAFGVERGLVVLFKELDTPTLALVERGTGRILETLAPIDVSGPAEEANVRIERDRGWLAVSSFMRRGRLTVFGITCE